MSVLSDAKLREIYNEACKPHQTVMAAIHAGLRAVADAAISADRSIRWSKERKQLDNEWQQLREMERSCKEILDRAARAEPVAWETDAGNGLMRYVTDRKYQKFAAGIQRFYRPYAPPAAPVVPEEMQHQPMRADESRSDQLEAYAYVNGWNACRRAMLASTPAPSQDNGGRK